MSQKYAALSYDTSNIGDTIQTLAATRFLPRIDAYVLRESVDKFRAEEKHKLIMNGWWMHRPQHFPPSKDIEPLLISMHFDPAQEKKLFRDKTIKYLVENGPVGCRDMVSLELCKKYNVPAYFSGCLTSTFVANPKIKRDDFILTVNVSQKIIDEVKKRTARPVLSIEKDIYPGFNDEDRMKIAKCVLGLCHRAHCVISPNLHTALPNVALETPVLHLMPEEKKFLKKYHDHLAERLSGLDNLFNSASETEFLNNKNCYNFDSPPANPKAYQAMRERLVKTASEFTGCNNETPTLRETVWPSAELLKILTVDPNNPRLTLKGFLRNFLQKTAKSMLSSL